MPLVQITVIKVGILENIFLVWYVVVCGCYRKTSFWPHVWQKNVLQSSNYNNKEISYFN